MQISKEMLIGELLQVDENMAQILMALHRMPVFSDGVSGRGLHGSRNSGRETCKCDQRISGSEAAVMCN